MSSRVRIDRLLVERGLFESRAKAQAAIAAGRVKANHMTVHRPSEEFSIDAVLSAEPAHPWVSRGGIKLAAALEHFAHDPCFDPAGRVCLDIGASTGGFTHALLARGARRVYAVDVGRDQLHERLRMRAEVVSMESTDIRGLAPARLHEAAELIVIDVSFISLKLVLPPALALAAERAALLALVKPQFEVGRGRTSAGIVHDPALQARVCEEIGALVASLGWNVVGTMAAPIRGSEGNQEYFIAAKGG